jgi:hypothetical protein
MHIIKIKKNIKGGAVADDGDGDGAFDDPLWRQYEIVLKT